MPSSPHRAKLPPPMQTDKAQCMSVCLFLTQGLCSSPCPHELCTHLLSRCSPGEPTHQDRDTHWYQWGQAVLPAWRDWEAQASAWRWPRASRPERGDQDGTPELWAAVSRDTKPRVLSWTSHFPINLWFPTDPKNLLSVKVPENFSHGPPENW